MCKPTKSIIFGLPGQDSYFLAKILAERGEIVTGVYRTNSPAIHDFLNIGLTELVKCDLNDAYSVQRLISRIHPDAVYNLAASSSVGNSFSLPADYIRNNTVSHLNLLESLRSRCPAAKLYYAGSSEELSLTSPYGVSKDTVRNLNDIYRKTYGMKIVHTQNFNHSSWRTSEEFLFGKIIKYCAGGPDISEKLKLGNLFTQKDITYSADVMRAGVLLMDNEVYDTVKVASGKLTTMADIVKWAFEFVGISNYKDFLQYDDAFVRPAESIQQEEECLFLRSLGWAPTLSPKQLVENSILEYKEKRINGRN